MDDYLKQLADLMNENARKSKEENMSFSEDVNKKMTDTPMSNNQRFPLTKQIKAQNPGIPQDDMQDYAQSVKEDTDENMMAIGGMSGGLRMLKPAAQAGMKLLPKVAPKIAEALDNAPRYAKDLAEEYLPKSISSKVDDLYYGSKAKDNVAKLNNTANDMARIKALEDMAMKRPRDQIVIPEGQKPFDLDLFQQNLEIEKAIEAQAQRLAAEKAAQSQNPQLLQEAMEKTIAVRKK